MPGRHAYIATLFVIFLIALSTPAQGAHATDISGKWAGTSEVRCGGRRNQPGRCNALQNITFDFQQEGTKVSGSYTCAFGTQDCLGLHEHGKLVGGSYDGANLVITVDMGTGATCQFKGGVGSSSRRLRAADGGWTVGALVVSNFGWKEHLTIAGVPVGRELIAKEEAAKPTPPGGGGSIVMVLATDAPVSSRQLGRVARRAFHGLGRLGSFSGNGSGDIALAFSTSSRVPYEAPDAPLQETRVHDARLNPVFLAAVEATEEAIVDSLFAATTVVGRDGNTSPELPVTETVEILDRYGRIA